MSPAAAPCISPQSDADTCLHSAVGGDAVDFEPITRDYYDTIINIQRDAAAGDS